MAKDFMEIFLQERSSSEKSVSNLDTEKIQLLSIKTLTPSSGNFYDVSEVADLKESIKEHGLLQPIVTNNGATIISGHRRFEAFRQLYVETGDEKYSMIPAIIKHPADSIEAQMMLIECNSTSRVLSPYELMEQAKQYDALLVKAKDYGYEYSGRRRDIVAKMMKLSSSKVARLSAIDKHLIDSWMDVFREGRISESVAYEISKLDAEGQESFSVYVKEYCGDVDDICLFDIQDFAEERNESLNECAKSSPVDPPTIKKYSGVNEPSAPEPESEEACSTTEQQHEATLQQWREIAEAEESLEDAHEQEHEHENEKVGGYISFPNQSDEPPVESPEKESSPYEFIGKRLAQIREELGKSRKDMADFLGWYPGTYSTVENGGATAIDNLCNAAKTLHVSLDWLVGFSDNRKGGIQ